MGAEQLWLTWGQTLPFSFTQVSPALNTKQHLELDINDVFYRDNGQLSIAQHFPKAQSRDFFVQYTAVLTKQEHQSQCKPNHADHNSYCNKMRPKAELKT